MSNNARHVRTWLKALAGFAALGLRCSVCGAAWMPGTSPGMTALDLGAGDPRHD